MPGAFERNRGQNGVDPYVAQSFFGGGGSSLRKSSCTLEQSHARKPVNDSRPAPDARTLRRTRLRREAGRTTEPKQFLEGLLEPLPRKSGMLRRDRFCLCRGVFDLKCVASG